MAQQSNTSFPIDPYTTSGIELATKLNELNEAANTSQSGTSRPLYAKQGFVWSDITNAVNKMKYYTGTSDLSILEYDTIGNRAIVNGGDSISDKSKNILHKNTNTSQQVPIPSDLKEGEIVINTADKIIYFLDDAGAIASVGAGAGLPAGSTIDFAGAVAPVGYLPFGDAEYEISVYQDLYNAIGDAWATTGGRITPSVGFFRVPPQEVDGLGLFARGAGATNGVVGTYQEDVFKEHTHTVSNTWYGGWSSAYSAGTSRNGVSGASIAINNTGDTVETRPRSITMLKCIKF